MAYRVRSFTPDVPAFTRGTEAEMARAVTLGVRDTALGMKEALRSRIRGAGFNQAMANIVRSEVYPRRDVSIEAASVVFERRNKPGGDTANLISVFDKGPLITAKNGRFLAIPSKAVKQGRYHAENRGRKRVTPRDFEKRMGITLRFVRGQRGLAFLVADGARLSRSGFISFPPPLKSTKRGQVVGPHSRRTNMTVICFILVPAVRLDRRIDWEAEAVRAHNALNGNILKHWA